ASSPVSSTSHTSPTPLVRLTQPVSPTSPVSVYSTRTEAPKFAPMGMSLRTGAIAIVGMSGKYPDAKNVSEYWQNLVQAKDSVREIPRTRFNVSDYYDPNPTALGKMYCKELGALEGIEYFDPLFFRLSPADAESMDPQHRLFLEEGYKAFEDAGYSPGLLSNIKCGIYLGIMSHEYELLLAQQKALTTNILGTNPAIAAARLAYLLNLKGPAIPIDTACSSSLVATHLACQALKSQEIDMALVGGVSLYLTPESYIGMCSAGMLSPDGRCKTCDASANGFVPGEGVGALVLKRLSDAQADHDQIYGVIIGSGINQDGATNGITAPSIKSQIELKREIYEKYEIDPASISYVEMHGTGTQLGDPIELEALATVFEEKTPRKQYCALGSVKSNIGHTSAAAGMASVHKVLLSMQQKKLVPSLHFKQPNPHFDFAASPFYVNTAVRDWQSEAGVPRRAAVSSFGYSGTNAHLVIEEYIADWQDTYPPAKSPQSPSLFILSAKSEQQLTSYAQEMKEWIQKHGELNLADVAFTLQMGRAALEHRLAILADSQAVLLKRLDSFIHKQASAGLYTAQAMRSQGTGSSRIDAMLFEKESDGQSLLRIWCQEKKLDKIALAWIKGVHVDWKTLYGEQFPHRVSLPTYPFARESYWMPARHAEGVSHPRPLSPDTSTSASVAEPDGLLAFTISYLINILSAVLKISLQRLDPEIGFDEYGLDSLAIHRLQARMEGVFGLIPITTFFQYKCIRDLAYYFLIEHAETIHALFQQRSNGQPLPSQNIVRDARTGEVVACSPQDRASIQQQIQQHIPDQRAQIESLHATLDQPAQEMEEILARLLWVQLQTLGWFTKAHTLTTELKARAGLPAYCHRWLDETIRILAQKKYISYDEQSGRVTNPISIDHERTWQEWERWKAVWLAHLDLSAQAALVEVTLRGLPKILTGQSAATTVLFPKSSRELVEGVYKHNRVTDFFNAILADAVVAYLNEIRKSEGSARLRILEVGAGTGGTSAMIFQKLLPYQEYIQEYCYTD
ncbi:MAG: hypothetical protein E6J34_19405, partial [Chloroflexi bacterium]